MPDDALAMPSVSSSRPSAASRRSSPAYRGAAGDQARDRVEALVLGIEHVEQAALPELELQAVRLGDVRARARVLLELRQARAVGDERVPRLPHVALDLVAHASEPCDGFVDTRFGLAHALAVAEAAEEVVAQAQHRVEVLVRPGDAVDVAVAGRTRFDRDARHCQARARAFAIVLRGFELLLGAAHGRMIADRLLDRLAQGRTECFGLSSGGGSRSGGRRPVRYLYVDSVCASWP